MRTSTPATVNKRRCAPKGAGFLYVRRELQHDVHPLMVSGGTTATIRASSTAARSRARAIHPRTRRRSPGSTTTTGMRSASCSCPRTPCRATSLGGAAHAGFGGVLPPDDHPPLPAGAPPDLKERRTTSTGSRSPCSRSTGRPASSVVSGLQRRGRSRERLKEPSGAALGGCRVRERVLEHVERLLGRRGQLEAERLSSTATVRAFVSRLQRSVTSMPSADRW